MAWLLDTNVLSELRRLRSAPKVAAGFDYRGNGSSARTYGRDTRQRRL
jgi:predicted nucleic acid-binding protein